MNKNLLTFMGAQIEFLLSAFIVANGMLQKIKLNADL